eukprot:41386_1
MSVESRSQDYLIQIISAGYGFDVPEIQNALQQTNYESVEAAVQFLFANQQTRNTNATTDNSQPIPSQNTANTSAMGMLQSDLAVEFIPPLDFVEDAQVITVDMQQQQPKVSAAFAWNNQEHNMDRNAERALSHWISSDEHI